MNETLATAAQQGGLDHESPQALERFMMRLAQALHGFGTPADHLEDVLANLADVFCLQAHVLITPTSITACFGTDASPRMYLIRSNQGDTDLAKLSRLERLAEAVTLKQVRPSVAYRAIDEILAAPRAYGPGLVVLAFAVASGAVARVLGGGGNEVVAGATIGLAIGLLAQAAAQSRPLARIFELVAPFLSAGLALILTLVLGPYSMRVATLAGLIILVPGMATTTALTELATGHLVAGTARLVGAAVTFMKLGFGVAMGTQVAHWVLHPAAQEAMGGQAWTQWPALGVAALAVAVVLQAELRDLAWILLCALVGFAGLRLGAHLLGSELAPCGAAFCVTLFSNVYARFLRRTPSATQVPAMLLLVPGTVGYRSVAALMQNDVLGGMQAAFTMGLDAMALVAGALLAGLVLAPRKEV